jgi:hypothetical protein
MLTMGFCMVCARWQAVRQLASQLAHWGDFQGKFSKEIKKVYNNYSCVCVIEPTYIHVGSVLYVYVPPTCSIYIYIYM